MKYGVIFPDPAWQYRVWSKDTGQGRSAEAHYRTSSLDEMKRLPVPDLAARDCLLPMWCTWPTIQDAFELAAYWGFTYRTCGWIWVKSNKRRSRTLNFFPLEDQGNWFTGMGYWTRANSEPVLLFAQGSPRRKSKSVQQIVVADASSRKRVRWTQRRIAIPSQVEVHQIMEHSRKPDTIYKYVEALVPGPYLEMFARRPREGWDVWGDEVESTLHLLETAKV